MIHSQPGCGQFPPEGIPSDCAFTFSNTTGSLAGQLLQDTIDRLASLRNDWWRHSPGNPDIGRTYIIKCPKKGEFDIIEMKCVFNT